MHRGRAFNVALDHSRPAALAASMSSDSPLGTAHASGTLPQVGPAVLRRPRRSTMPTAPEMNSSTIGGSGTLTAIYCPF